MLQEVQLVFIRTYGEHRTVGCGQTGPPATGQRKLAAARKTNPTIDAPHSVVVSAASQGVAASGVKSRCVADAQKRP